MWSNLAMNDVVANLRTALGDDRVDTDPDERFWADWSGHGASRPLAVVRPRSTDEVATVLRICHAAGQTVVPQGGRSGLAGGGTPTEADLVVSLEAFSGIEEIDTAAGTMTVRAGTILEAAQQAAAEHGLELAYDLGARGSCQIGGNLATNAGGNRVVRYGMAREQVLGIEVVLADGTVISSLTKMLKNNAGYDLKHVFIGSEGTLGIITRAVLRLHPRSRTRVTALCSTPSYGATVDLLRHAQRTTGGVTAFEVMWPEFYRFMSEARGGLSPISHGAPMYVLVEISGDDPDHDEQRFEAMLADAHETGLVLDATVAHSAKDTSALWSLRESEPLDQVASPVNFDISLPIGHIEEFVVECRRRLADRWPAVLTFPFGHIADSNLHMTVSIGPTDHDGLHAIDETVYGTVRDWGGSVSAEHGIGTHKRPFLSYSRSDAEIDVMRRIKAALDPTGILNPGKVIPAR